MCMGLTPSAENLTWTKRLAPPSERECSSRLPADFPWATVSPGAPSVGSHHGYGLVSRPDHTAQFLLSCLSLRTQPLGLFLWRTLTSTWGTHRQPQSVLSPPLPPCSPVSLTRRTDPQEFFLSWCRAHGSKTRSTSPPLGLHAPAPHIPPTGHHSSSNSFSKSWPEWNF